jgi:hypothetical protein
VVVAADIAGQKQLVAYVVAKPEYTQSLDIEGLQKHVERLCTPYMVPGIFIQLDALPLLPNGKVRAMLWGLLPRPLRSGLPCRLSCVCRSIAMRCRRPMQLGSRCASRPSKVRALRTEWCGLVAADVCCGRVRNCSRSTVEGKALHRGTLLAEPTNDIEKKLVLWSEELLGIKPVSTTANLFTMGGNSLFAVKLKNKIKADFSVCIQLVPCAHGKAAGIRPGWVGFAPFCGGSVCMRSHAQCILVQADVSVVAILQSQTVRTIATLVRNATSASDRMF